MPFLPPAIAKILRECIERQRAGHRTRGMVGLLGGRAEQYVERVADDLRDRSVVGEHGIGHADEIIVEQRTKYVGFERLNQCR